MAGSEPSGIFEFVEAAFDTVAFFVEIFAVIMGAFEVGARRNNSLHAAPLHMAA